MSEHENPADEKRSEGAVPAEGTSNQGATSTDEPATEENVAPRSDGKAFSWLPVDATTTRL